MRKVVSFSRVMWWCTCPIWHTPALLQMQAVILEKQIVSPANYKRLPQILFSWNFVINDRISVLSLRQRQRCTASYSVGV